METNTKLLGPDWADSMAADISKAESQVIITALSVQPPKKWNKSRWTALYDSWVTAAKRGVLIKIWIPRPHNAYPATLGNMSAANKLSKEGIHCQLVRDSKLLHAKTCIVDEQITYVGSGNFTAAACNHNHEAYLRVDSRLLSLDLLARWELLP